jgi:hypothetical protein
VYADVGAIVNAYNDLEADYNALKTALFTASYASPRRDSDLSTTLNNNGYTNLNWLARNFDTNNPSFPSPFLGVKLAKDTPYHFRAQARIQITTALGAGASMILQMMLRVVQLDGMGAQVPGSIANWARGPLVVIDQARQAAYPACMLEANDYVLWPSSQANDLVVFVGIQKFPYAGAEVAANISLDGDDPNNHMFACTRLVP